MSDSVWLNWQVMLVDMDTMENPRPMGSGRTPEEALANLREQTAGRVEAAERANRLIEEQLGR